MNGPCLCGDPYCPSCGDPGRAKIEAAEEQAVARMADAGLTADEYEIVVTTGLAAVLAARDAVRRAEVVWQQNQAAAESCRDY